MWRIRLRPTIAAADASTACRFSIKRTDAIQQTCSRHLTSVVCMRHASHPPSTPTTPAAAAAAVPAPPKPSNSRFSTPDKKGSGGHFGTADRFKLVACLLMEGKTSSFYEKAADALSSRFHSTLEPRDYILILRVLSDKARDPPILPRKLGFIIKEAVRRGFLRDFLQPSWSVLQSCLRSGDYGRVVELSNFLLEAERTDCVKALRSVEVGSTRDSDEQILQRAIQGHLVPRSEAPVFHPNRRFYHARLKGMVGMGAIDQALKVITHDMPQSEALCRLFPRSPGWNPTSTPSKNYVPAPASPVFDPILLQNPEGTGDHLPTHIKRVQPSDIAPTVITYLLVARAAFQQQRYDVGLSMFLSALRAAEKDWVIKQPRILQYLNIPGQGTSLDAVNPKLLEQIRDLHQILCEYYSHEVSEDDHVIADAMQAASAPTTLSPEQLDKVKLTATFKSLDDLPSFLYFAREDMWKFMWSLSVRGRSVGAAKGSIDESLHSFIENADSDDTGEQKVISANSGTAFVACLEKELPKDASTYLSLKQIKLYAMNPTWMKTWFLGPAPASLHIHCLDPKGAPSPSHINGKNYTKPPASPPTEILAANPSATLELLMRYLSSQHAYKTLLQIYTQSILPVYEEVNQENVVGLIQSGQVESLDATITLEAPLKSSFPLKIVAAPNAIPTTPPASTLPQIFTVATVPPALRTALPPLSPLVMSTITYAYIRTIALSGSEKAALQNLTSRAYINTISQQTPQPPPGSMQAFYQASGLSLQYVLAILQALPNSAYAFSAQVVDSIVKGILLPMQEYQEQVTAGSTQAARKGMSRLYHIESPTTREFLQQLYSELMKKYFSVRRYSNIVTLYEREQLLQHQPMLPLSVPQSLLLVQAYMWMGDVSQSLELYDECFPHLNSAQKVSLTAFVCHFLETHVVKSLHKRGQKGLTQSISPGSYTSPKSKSPLPLPGNLATHSVLSMGSPILSTFGGPAYRTASTFTILGPSSPEKPMSLYERSELDVESRRVESWKRAFTEFTLRRTAPTSPHVRQQVLQKLHATASEYLPVDLSALFDDVEFLQPALQWKALPNDHQFGYLPPNEKDAPQGGHFSFGMESPAFSSYATLTSALAVNNAEIAQADIDPLIHYQMARIRTLLDQLLAEPQLLHYNSPKRICDLRSGVSYNRGRCIIYLLSLWIKYNHRPNNPQRYRFLLPRTLLKQAHDSAFQPQPEDDSNFHLSDLENIMLHSYSAEFLLQQYFPGRVKADSVEVNVQKQLSKNPSTQQLGVKTHRVDPYPSDGVDAFGRPINEQPYVVFTVLVN